MEWLKEWGKPAIVIVAIGFAATCTNQRLDGIERRFNSRVDGIDQRLQVIDARTFEMNTRLSRIEGKLGVTAAASDDKTPSANAKD